MVSDSIAVLNGICTIPHHIGGSRKEGRKEGEDRGHQEKKESKKEGIKEEGGKEGGREGRDVETEAENIGGRSRRMNKTLDSQNGWMYNREGREEGRRWWRRWDGTGRMDGGCWR
jgi:hypothetical protein